jgi:ribA/ribD-fused uncharacterized protein
MHSQIRTYLKSDVISFRSTKQQFGGLSNMAGGYAVNVNDIIIGSSEALYQACKFPHLPEVQELILAEASPMSAKMVSNRYSDQIRPDWEAVRFKIMYWCLEVKLIQNWERFYRDLKATGTKQIVEFSPKDKVWAACPINEFELQGMNALGRLLMKLREEYVFKNHFPECVEALEIPDFNLLGFPIDDVCNPAMALEDGYLVAVR